jgi:hypothetical protein
MNNHSSIGFGSFNKDGRVEISGLSLFSRRRHMASYIDKYYFEYREDLDESKDIKDYCDVHYLDLRSPFNQFIEDRFVEKTPGEWSKIKENINIYIDGLVDIMKARFHKNIERERENASYASYDFLKWHREFETERGKIKHVLQNVFGAIELFIDDKDVSDIIIADIKFKFENLICDVFRLEYCGKKGERTDFSEYSYDL